MPPAVIKMNGNDLFVGSITILLSLTALIASVSGWTAPYKLKIAHQISERFGRRFARLFYFAIAALLAAVATAIFLGLRPGFAHPN